MHRAAHAAFDDGIEALGAVTGAAAEVDDGIEALGVVVDAVPDTVNDDDDDDGIEALGAVPVYRGRDAGGDADADDEFDDGIEALGVVVDGAAAAAVDDGGDDDRGDADVFRRTVPPPGEFTDGDDDDDEDGDDGVAAAADESAIRALATLTDTPVSMVDEASPSYGAVERLFRQRNARIRAPAGTGAHGAAVALPDGRTVAALPTQFDRAWLDEQRRAVPGESRAAFDARVRGLVPEPERGGMEATLRALMTHLRGSAAYRTRAPVEAIGAAVARSAADRAAVTGADVYDYVRWQAAGDEDHYLVEAGRRQSPTRPDLIIVSRPCVCGEQCIARRLTPRLGGTRAPGANPATGFALMGMISRENLVRHYETGVWPDGEAGNVWCLMCARHAVAYILSSVTWTNGYPLDARLVLQTHFNSIGTRHGYRDEYALRCGGAGDSVFVLPIARNDVFAMHVQWDARAGVHRVRQDDMMVQPNPPDFDLSYFPTDVDPPERTEAGPFAASVAATTTAAVAPIIADAYATPSAYPPHTAVAAVMRAAAQHCVACGAQRASFARALAALFDACVEHLPPPPTAGGAPPPPLPSVDEWCETFARGGWHASRYPAERSAECPVDAVLAFREALVTGVTRGNGAPGGPVGATTRGGGSRAVGVAAADDDDDPDDDDGGGNSPRPRKRTRGAVAAAAGGADDSVRLCRGAQNTQTLATQAGYHRQDAVYDLLRRGWPRRLQSLEGLALARELVDETDWTLRTEPPGADDTRADPRRRFVARRCLVRWWAYALLGRWRTDTEPFADWETRARIVRAVDVDVDADAAAFWRAAIIDGTGGYATGEDAAARTIRAVGVTLALQAVVIESVWRLSALREYLCDVSAWAEFETQSVRARDVWRRAWTGRGADRAAAATQLTRFVAALPRSIPRCQDGDAWRVHLARALRAVYARHEALPPGTERAFVAAVVAVPDVARVAWAAAREACRGGRGGGAVTGAQSAASSGAAVTGSASWYATRARMHYVGRDFATGARRPTWDAHAAPATVAQALALGEAFRVALVQCDVPATTADDVFATVRDLYVQTTGPRALMARLVARLGATYPRAIGLLAALHDAYADHIAVRAVPLDAYTTALQRAARTRRVGFQAHGRDDWLLVCGACRVPHTPCVPATARAFAAAVADEVADAVRVASVARSSARANARLKRTRMRLPETHGFLDVSMDTHARTFYCRLADATGRAPELVYPLPMTGRIVWFHARAYTICPLCGHPMQFNPAVCASVGFTFACIACSVRVMRAHADARIPQRRR